MTWFLVNIKKEYIPLATSDNRMMRFAYDSLHFSELIKSWTLLFLKIQLKPMNQFLLRR